MTSLAVTAHHISEQNTMDNRKPYKYVPIVHSHSLEGWLAGIGDEY
jgi:hypothetical protein